MFPVNELGAFIARLTNGRLTPWVKQIPTVVAFVVALLVVLVSRMHLESPGQVLAATAVVAAGTAVAVLLPWRDPGQGGIDARWSVLIPCSSFVAVALLRAGTGGSSSAFSALLILPVIWVAAEPGLWNVLIAGVGTCVALLLPEYLDPAQVDAGGTRELAHAFYAPFVFLVASVIINEVARRLRDAATESARLKDEFLGMVSHELRNPLTSVLGYLELLNLDPTTPLTETQAGYVSIAERNAHRLQHLVSDLLFTAQVSSGGFLVETSPVDVSTVVAEALESARPNADEAGVALRAELEPELVAPADAERLAQAVDNLLSNAIKFTPHDGTVTVKSRRDGAWAVAEVADTGIGIDASELARLSERFYRAASATDARIPGVGLGLSITRAIAQAHGGSLTVDSTLGTGTTFTLRIPLV